ncbi:flavin reductase family protein [Conexibacter woesei]|uniref:flavin reductase family protein n=1 Tax=Conexibacter woesei TaxID=191495 RepID=UPI00040B3786|nr:flavin reductase family protein [Conexibacter woesei]
MIFYEPQARDRELLPHDPFKALVAPRPIGWISTVDGEGVPNLAPYSFFNAACDTPPILMFSSAGMKHSATHAHATREFVWNLPTWELREAMNATSAELAGGESEFAHAGLSLAPSRIVGVPRVAEAPVALECRVTQTLSLSDLAGADVDRHVVFGQVVGVHIDERFVDARGQVDTAAMQPIARCGYRDEYAVVRELFRIARPA